ncbi:S9 family peptidase [Halococcus saccharolyticus]|uniref:Peptidase S9 prolyl oligopeptidase active site domain protein n=1 Tax=Halococcus saccharolyticus DSM 5350 TaxID=1227455 RepID=M0MJZ1_9EURY|nr:prolyl oligopeptidase family serine peptidase [Halococcus saccharolyticus]EMA44775.1 peptidase S9 prolyl oligopeptidase active site domain protein [Halococcus saccharolyticus DSM 5350]
MSNPDDVLEALASLPSFHHPTASEDGDRVAFYYDESGRNELHVLDVETGDRHQVSHGEVPRNARWGVEWSADGERVFFHLDEDGNEQNDIHAIDVSGPTAGETEPVVEMDGQISLADVGEDGETLLLGATRDGQMNLYRHDLSAGETTKLTDYDRAAAAGLLSPDCERIAYATNESDDFENMDVYVAEADGSNARNLALGETGAECAPSDWSPDGESLLVTDNTENFGRCGVYDLGSEALRASGGRTGSETAREASDDVTWYGDLTADEMPVCFLPDGERFLALRVREAAVMPLVYDRETGDAHELDLPEGVATFPGEAVLDDDRVLVMHTTSDRRPELLAYDLATDEHETLLAAEYGGFDPDGFADAEYFTFESTGDTESGPAAAWTGDNETLEIGALLYDSGERPSPLIVNPHGGPRGADLKRFDPRTQFLLKRGYSVLQVNYRGSAHYGREFVRLLYDDWGGGEQADIAAATRLVSEYDWIDDDRVAVYGGSYGGYSAYCQMTMYPELYDAGIASVGLTDLEDMYENTMPHFRTELMEKNLGTPEESPEIYDERSPVNHAANLSAPILMVHGVNDRRVPVSQARIFREALDDLGFDEGEGGDYEYEELGEEGHGSSDIDQKIRTYQLLDDFLDRRLGGAKVESTAD